ncbi:phosphate ABC transporter permease PstA [Rhodomicrobium sp. Az07]|uniref:phosphate ABC transporter permease PstA n=1 Tax=Rhodomicrobium sp. Az07 TaxID=2839034 RepID=UPI003530224E
MPESDAEEAVGRFDNPALMRRRRREEVRFQAYGLIAIALSFSFLVILFGTIITNGWTAFFQTSIELPIKFDAAEIDPEGTRNPRVLAQANYQKLAYQALYEKLGLENPTRQQRRAANELLSRDMDTQLRRMVEADPSIIGTTQSVWGLASGNIDALVKGKIDRKVPQENRQVSDLQIEWIDKLTASGAMQKQFNTGLFTNFASSQPETAGLAVALIGSLYMMLIVVLLSVPFGVAAAIYLEEFAPKNRITDIIEVNINNLAAVPSIVFGLLGLAVFINFAGLPRSASLVGGLVLTLMTLPTIIIATRAAITAVPPSIREAALGIGASKVQTVFHHVLPLSLPGIITGTIIGLVQAIGETAPLLMIGMVAFVVEAPQTPLDPATALPVQIYMWATEAERGFVEKTAGATIVLLGIIAVMSIFAMILRKRYERKW